MAGPVTTDMSVCCTNVLSIAKADIKGLSPAKVAKVVRAVCGIRKRDAWREWILLRLFNTLMAGPVTTNKCPVHSKSDEDANWPCKDLSPARILGNFIEGLHLHMDF